jgi:hypothetical protein
LSSARPIRNWVRGSDVTDAGLRGPAVGGSPAPAGCALCAGAWRTSRVPRSAAGTHDSAGPLRGLPRRIVWPSAMSTWSTLAMSRKLPLREPRSVYVHAAPVQLSSACAHETLSSSSPPRPVGRARLQLMLRLRGADMQVRRGSLIVVFR